MRLATWKDRLEVARAESAGLDFGGGTGSGGLEGGARVAWPKRSHCPEIRTAARIDNHCGHARKRFGVIEWTRGR